MDNIFLLCKKQTIQMPPKFCKWEGVIGDYVQHVKKNHPNSYILLKTEQKTFQWTLPQLGDQIDQGVILCNNQHFIYKIAYRSRLEEFQFTLQNIEGDAKTCCFTLQKILGGRLLEDKRYFKTNTFNMSNSQNGVIISRQDINEFTDSYGSFMWSLYVDCN